MFGIGGQELILLMLIGLVVLGPERLPQVANQLGRWLGQARRMTRVMKRQLEEELQAGKSQSINPPSREPSYQPYRQEPPPVTPRDDDTYSPEHAGNDPATGVDKPAVEDRAAADAERDAVTEAEAAAADPGQADKKAPS